MGISVVEITKDPEKKTTFTARESDELERGQIVYSRIAANVFSIERKDELVHGIPREMGYVCITKTAHFFPIGFEDKQEGTRVWYNFVRLPGQRLSEITNMIEKEKEKAVADLQTFNEPDLARTVSDLSFSSLEEEKRLDGLQVITISVMSSGVLSEPQRTKLVEEVKRIGDKIRDTFAPNGPIEMQRFSDVIREK
jgi:hypothetical protein